MDTVLRTKFAGFDKARVVRFSQGSVITELEVAASGINSVQIQEAIIQQANAGLVEGLQIDPDFVRVRESKSLAPATATHKLIHRFISVQVGLTPEEIRNYVIIAVACFLVMVATAFAVCMIVRTRRKRTKEIVSRFSGVRWLVEWGPPVRLLSLY